MSTQCGTSCSSRGISTHGSSKFGIRLTDKTSCATRATLKGVCRNSQSGDTCRVINGTTTVSCGSCSTSGAATQCTCNGSGFSNVCACSGNAYVGYDDNDDHWNAVNFSVNSLCTNAPTPAPSTPSCGKCPLSLGLGIGSLAAVNISGCTQRTNLVGVCSLLSGKHRCTYVGSSGVGVACDSTTNCGGWNLNSACTCTDTTPRCACSAQITLAGVPLGVHITGLCSNHTKRSADDEASPTMRKLLSYDEDTDDTACVEDSDCEDEDLQDCLIAKCHQGECRRVRVERGTACTSPLCVNLSGQCNDWGRCECDALSCGQTADCVNSDQIETDCFEPICRHGFCEVKAVAANSTCVNSECPGEGKCNAHGKCRCPPASTTTHVPATPTPILPQPPSQCLPFVLRKQCENNDTFAVFTPYPPNFNASAGGCNPEQPCRLQCGRCSVSVFVRALPKGEHVIEYFVTGGTDCLLAVEAFVFASSTYLGGGVGAKRCEIDCDDVSCGFVAPYTHGFIDLSDSSESSTTTSASRYHAQKCRVTKDKCSHKPALVLPLSDAHRGVALHVPRDFEIAYEHVSVRGPNCEDEVCDLILPVPRCTKPPQAPCGGLPCPKDKKGDDSEDSEKHGVYKVESVVAEDSSENDDWSEDRVATLAVQGAVATDLNACETPSATWVQEHRSVADERVAARAWANAVDSRLAALMDCRADAVSSSEQQVIDLPTHQEFSCDYKQCSAALATPSLVTGGHAPKTVAEHLGRAAELAHLGRGYYSNARYNQARQMSCCAEAIVHAVLTRYQCGETHCTVSTIYPGSGADEQYAAIDGAPSALGLRKRSVVGAGDEQYVLARKANKAQEGAAGEFVLLFEECDEARGAFVPDNDLNDAVFGVAASSMVESRAQGAWLASTLHIAPLAIGSTRDFALDLRFEDAGLPAGARVRVVHYGIAASETCYTVNSLADETLECPSTNSVRLIRSLRAALPQTAAAGVDSPFVNTRSDAPYAPPAHLTSVFITLPRHHHQSPTLRLAFELRDRAGAQCVVQTTRWQSEQKMRGIGVIVPAPFRYPVEGVPAYIDELAVPSGGLCVDGDNTRARCSEEQECPGGYCELSGKDAYHCVDSLYDGVNSDALCSRLSQCPYGRCYGVADDEQGAYPALIEFLKSGGKTSVTWFAQPGAEFTDRSTYYDSSALDNNGGQKK